MVIRRPYLLIGAVGAAGVLVAIALLVRGSDPPPAVPLGKDGIASRATFLPRVRLFGEPFTARLELLVDRDVLDPDKITVDADLAPFDAGGDPVERRRDFEQVTRLTYDFPLDCLQTICVPERDRKNFGFREAVVRHHDERLLNVEWPIVSIGSRLRDPSQIGVTAAEREGRVTLGPADDPDWRVTLGPAAPTYRADPALLAGLLVLFALALLAAALILFEVAFPGTPLGLRLRRRPKLSPLERALVVLERANQRGIEEEQRLALDRLAGELRTTGAGELAGAAHHLAWAHNAPETERTADLSADVRQLIAGRSNGRA